jgi:hypothetical protein
MLGPTVNNLCTEDGYLNGSGSRVLHVASCTIRHSMHRGGVMIAPRHKHDPPAAMDTAGDRLQSANLSPKPRAAG